MTDQRPPASPDEISTAALRMADYARALQDDRWIKRVNFDGLPEAEDRRPDGSICGQHEWAEFLISAYIDRDQAAFRAFVLQQAWSIAERHPSLLEFYTPDPDAILAFYSAGKVAGAVQTDAAREVSR